jgi:hypothetical protein
MKPMLRFWYLVFSLHSASFYSQQLPTLDLIPFIRLDDEMCNSHTGRAEAACIIKDSASGEKH